MKHNSDPYVGWFGARKDTDMARARSAKAAHDIDEARRATALGPLEDSLGYALRRAQLASFQEFMQAFAEVDIRPAQFGVLVVLESNPGLKQSEVSAALGIKRTNFVALFDSLETRGLATRAATPADRRSHALFLTSAGTALVEKLKAIHGGYESRLVAKIGAGNRARLLDLLHRLAELAGDAAEEDG